MTDSYPPRTCIGMVPEQPMTSIALEDLKGLFDIATESMDFGSGFLDYEEVSILRRVAITLGLDPMVGTPDTFRASFAHEFTNPTTRRQMTNRDYRNPTYEIFIICGICSRKEKHSVHHGKNLDIPAPYDD